MARYRLSDQYTHDGRKGWHGPHKPVRIVLHSTESHDTAGLADVKGVMGYWDRQNKGIGAHKVIDADGNSGQYVPDKVIAWHVLNRNTGSLGIEIIAFARFTNFRWLTRPKQLHRVAKQLAKWSIEYGIPLEHDLERGVSKHAEQSAKYGDGQRSDPGAGFPFRLVLRVARWYKRNGFERTPNLFAAALADARERRRRRRRR